MGSETGSQPSTGYTGRLGRSAWSPISGCYFNPDCLCQLVRFIRFELELASISMLKNVNKLKNIEAGLRF